MDGAVGGCGVLGCCGYVFESQDGLALGGEEGCGEGEGGGEVEEEEGRREGFTWSVDAIGVEEMGWVESGAI